MSVADKKVNFRKALKNNTFSCNIRFVHVRNTFVNLWLIYKGQNSWHLLKERCEHKLHFSCNEQHFLSFHWYARESFLETTTLWKFPHVICESDYQPYPGLVTDHWSQEKTIWFPAIIFVILHPTWYSGPMVTINSSISSISQKKNKIVL